MANNSSKKIIEQIKQIAGTANCDFVEATIEWCNRNNIDHEFAGNILKKNRSFKMQIKKDASNLNLLK